MSDKLSTLTPQWQSQGWKQFLTARSEMLGAYDNARNKGIKSAVKVNHGIVADAEFRKWLTTFLPKKYGDLWVHYFSGNSEGRIAGPL